MKISVETQEASAARAELLAIPMSEATASRKSRRGLASFDRATGGALKAALDSGDFGGRAGETSLVYGTGRGAPGRVLLIGLGKADPIDAEALRRAAGRAVQAATTRGARSVAVRVPALGRLGAEDAAQALAEGALLAGYRFDDYKQRKPDRKAPPARVTLVFDDPSSLRAVRRAAKRGCVLAESQNTARRLSNEPPNALPPASLAREAKKLARETGLRCTVMDAAELRRRKMGAILAVGGGSVHPPRLIVLEHNRPKAKTRSRRPTICVVGKGITFDSGGLSLKPAAGMPDMKHDMSGAAAVVGIMQAAAELELPIHLVGLIAAAENMPGGRAYRPSDIVRSMSGKTIEILNTDAEGRVVLADALHYARTTYRPEAMIDLATLTGACIIALGPWATGVFGPHDELAERLCRAGETTGERAWRLPLFDEHREAMRGAGADLRNAGGRDAGASTAAAFLSAFVGDTPWVHLDIAGTADTEKTGPYQPRGATGVGVRLVTEVLQSWEPLS